MIDIINMVRKIARPSDYTPIEEVTKPWGGYITYFRNIEIKDLIPGVRDLFKNDSNSYYVTLKHLILKDELSIQSHKERDEGWYLDSGNAVVYLGRVKDDFEESVESLTKKTFPSDKFILVPRMTVHTARCIGTERALITEISVGNALEEDNVRYYDKHFDLRPEDDKLEMMLKGYKASLTVEELQDAIDKRRDDRIVAGIRF